MDDERDDSATAPRRSSGRRPAGKRGYLAPETRSMWRNGAILCTGALALALIPRAGRTRQLAAGALGTAGVAALLFALLETAVDPVTVRRRLRPYRDLLAMFLR